MSKLYPRLLKSRKRILLLRGGSGSTKTYSVCQAIAVWLVTGNLLGVDERQKGLSNFSVVRKHNATHDKAALRDFKNILLEYGLMKFVTENKTNKTFTYEDGDYTRVVEFFGADDEQKVRGPRRDFLYCNEANELHFEKEFNQLNLRTRKKVIVDFNPDDPDNWLNQEIELKRAITKGDIDIEVSTHWDNPFMSKQEHDEIENLKNIDRMLWQIYAKGEYGRMVGQIFTNTESIRNGIPHNAKLLAYGLDFGYSNHPSALVGVYKLNNDLYIDEIFYETGLTNTDIADKLDGMGFDKHDEVYADCAEPKSIEELKRRGYNIIPAKKGKDSINYGINLMKQQKIWVTEESQNILKEFRKYKWKEDMNGELMNKPVDAFNHAIDAIRYVCMEKLEKQQSAGVFKRMFSKNRPKHNPFDPYL